MKPNDSARALIGPVADTTLVTINANGSLQASVVWVALHTTADGEDQLVIAHLREHQKIRNVRRDPRVALTIRSADRSAPMTPYLLIQDSARIQNGGALELIAKLARAKTGRDTNFPPSNSPPGYLTGIRIDKIGGRARRRGLAAVGDGLATNTPDHDVQAILHTLWPPQHRQQVHVSHGC